VVFGPGRLPEMMGHLGEGLQAFRKGLHEPPESEKAPQSDDPSKTSREARRDGFNPLWQAVQIGFNTIAPQQFTSDNDIIAAANAGQITLTPTTEVYRCSVLGRKSSAAGVPKTIKRRVRHRDVPAVPRGGAGGRPDR